MGVSNRSQMTSHCTEREREREREREIYLKTGDGTVEVRVRQAVRDAHRRSHSGTEENGLPSFVFLRHVFFRKTANESC